MDKIRRNGWIVGIAFFLNIALITCVIISVVSAFNNAREVSFAQNIENVRTLTNASASKIELEYLHYTQVIRTVSEYVNDYQGIGMTEEELRSFFAAYDSGQSGMYLWEMVDGELNGKPGSMQGFDAEIFNTEAGASISYKAQVYPELAKIFCKAVKGKLGIVDYTGEFMNPSAEPVKVAAITTTVRVREADSYHYKTLMLLVKSDYINQLISNNNTVNTLRFFDYSNIILDQNGNYVVSNSQFQGKNFVNYIALYNENFTETDAEELLNRLKRRSYSEVLYYKNNHGQDCVYTVAPVMNSSWHILSSVPLKSFHNSYNFRDNFLKFAVWFGILFLFDMILVLAINIQLRKRTIEAQIASNAKSEFLSSMSHDIRTPMNAILGMAAIADENLEEKQPDLETLRDCIKTIRTSGNHLLTLVNDILDISQIENGKFLLTEGDFSISDSVDNILEMMKPQIKEKNLFLEPYAQNIRHELIHGDELRMKQIYINILSNAIKYTNPGGRIKVELYEEEIQDKIRLSFRVSDTGIGMSPEFLNTVFDRFSRAVDTRVNTVRGTGLGMSISKQLVDLMGGKITAESTLNAGSVFTVVLDVPAAVIPEKQVSCQNRSVLFLDSDTNSLKEALRILTERELQAEAVQQERDVVSQVVRMQQKHAYDVVFLNWERIVETDSSSLHRLRQQMGEQVKLIVTTVSSVADIEQEARLQGADGVMTKPLFSVKMLRVMESAFCEKGNGKADVEQQKFDLRVLVAEDNHTNWKVLQKIMSRYGIRADWVENGSEAVQVVSSGEVSYDLVLMDIQMPVMNGYDATRRIRSLEEHSRASIPIYAMTADAFMKDVRKSMESGMNGHLAKPVEIDKLLRVFTRVSREKKPLQEGRR